MSWLTGYEFRRWFEFKIKDNPLILVNKGCPESCRESPLHDVEDLRGIYLYGKAKSFPDDIIFTADDGITIFKSPFDFEGWLDGDEKLWVKFAVDRPQETKGRGRKVLKKILKGYIYYGRKESKK